MLRLEEVGLTVGTRELLADASLHIHPGDRMGLVGANGTGKTSLLRLVMGELEAETGRVVRRGGAVFGYLPQKAVAGSERTVWAEARSGMAGLMALERQREEAAAAVAAGAPGAVHRQEEVDAAWKLAGGWAIDEKVGEVLHGLGFGPEDWHRPCNTFSGGWQMRIALARVLLSEPDLLLLDEPTNHLDLAARSWLARFLAQWKGTLLVVSHDRWLLDRAINRIAEIRHGRLESFRGNLTAWLAEKELREAQAVALHERQGEEIAKLQGFIDRFGAKATKASQAKSREKKLERIERVELPEASFRARLTLPEAPGCSQEVLELRGADLGWDQPVLRGVDLLLLRGERVAVLGPNGTGKSTLLAGLAGTLPLKAGRRRVGKDVRIGVFRQDLAQAIPPDRSALEHVLLTAPGVLPERARSALGALGLRGHDAMRPIGELSGGEKARVVLAAFAVQPANVLLLDEPTNHLDAVTVDVLIQALSVFEGTLVLVTHDRYLVEKLANVLVRIEGDRAVRYDRVTPELLEAPPREAKGGAKAPEAAVDHEERKRRQRERGRLEKRYEAAFEEASAIEQQMGALDRQMGELATDWDRMAPLVAQRAALERKLDALMDELAAIEAQLA
jgi:ATP-binding cassette subfamily F protein 3